MRIGIIAALPGELKPLVRRWEAKVPKDGVRIWTHQANECEWVAVCAGMGTQAAERAFAAAEEDGPLGMVLSVGWAGAVIPELHPGEARALSHIVDAETGEHFQLTSGKRQLTLVTTAHVVDSREKARLRSTYRSAVMVDMEAAAVARMAQDRGIPVGCIKGVSDGQKAKLPDLNPFISPAGHLKMVPFLAHLAIRPKYWPAVAELGKNSSRAAQAMCELVLEFMEEQNVERLNRTGRP